MRPAVQAPLPPPPKPKAETEPELDLELRDEDWDDDSVATLVDAVAIAPDGSMPSPLGDDDPVPLPFAQRYAQQAAEDYAKELGHEVRTPGSSLGSASLVEDDDPADDPPTRETPMALATALRAVATELPVPFDELPRPAEELGPVPLVPPPPRMPVKDAMPDGDPLVPKYSSAPPENQARHDSHIRPSPPRPMPNATPSGAFPPPAYPSSQPRVLSSPGVSSSPGMPAEPTPFPSRSGAFATRAPPSQPSQPSAPSQAQPRTARPFPSDTLRKVLLAYRPEMPPREWLYIIVPVAIAVGIAIGLAIVFVRIVHN